MLWFSVLTPCTLYCTRYGCYATCVPRSRTHRHVVFIIFGFLYCVCGCLRMLNFEQMLGFFDVHYASSMRKLPHIQQYNSMFVNHKLGIFMKFMEMRGEREKRKLRTFFCVVTCTKTDITLSGNGIITNCFHQWFSRKIHI